MEGNKSKSKTRSQTDLVNNNKAALVFRRLRTPTMMSSFLGTEIDYKTCSLHFCGVRSQDKVQLSSNTMAQGCF